jgi:hypothetical protein
LRKPREYSTEQLDAVREYSRQGLSANEIQRKLSRTGMGMQRSVLLGYVREFKGQKRQQTVSKYVPHKYRIAFFGGKHVAAYGTVRGRARRVQVYGNGRDLYSSMLLVSRHPPRERFLTIDAGSLLANPREYLSEALWDDRPEVHS